jgi:hypothetical protein
VSAPQPPKTNVDGQALFLRLKRIQLALRVYDAALIVGICAFAIGIREAFDQPGIALAFIVALFVACLLVFLGAMLYLKRSRCPNCNSAFSWNWVRGNVLKDEKAGRCVNCGIRINV